MNHICQACDDRACHLCPLGDGKKPRHQKPSDEQVKLAFAELHEIDARRIAAGCEGSSYAN